MSSPLGKPRGEKQQQRQQGELFHRVQDRKWVETNGERASSEWRQQHQAKVEEHMQHSSGGKQQGDATGRIQPVTSGVGSSLAPHRLSSSEILNENKQRQLKQQESFKKHLEQRQRELQESQQKMTPGDGDQCDSSPYQVNTGVPDYMKEAAAAKQLVPSIQQASRMVANKNPFDDASQVSGKSGFLSTLMGKNESQDKNYAMNDESRQELDSASDHGEPSGMANQQPETRYAKLAQEQARYTYDYSRKSNQGDGIPFYRKDLGTLLQECRASRSLVILIVAIALLLDNMLLTSVVPIIPAFLYKLRIERQHREQLASSSIVTASSNSNKLASLSPMQQTALRIEFEQELERRINQSLAAARDRYSGSFFHPRIRPDAWRPPSKARGRNGDQDDEDDVNDQVRDGKRNQADDNDDDDDDDDGNERQDEDKEEDGDESNDEDREARNRDDDDDGSADEDDAVNEQRGKSAKAVGPSTGQGRRRRPRALALGGAQMKANVSPKRKQDSDSPEEMRSEDWDKFRSKLISLANDTERLAGVCMQFVIGDADGSLLENSKDDIDTSSPPTRMDGSNSSSMKEPSAKGKQRKQKPNGKKAGAKKTPVNIGNDSKSPANNTSEQSIPDDKTKEQKDDELIISHEDIVQESFEVGVMFASKPIVQAIANPFIGTLTNKVGFTIPMFTGFVIMFLSTLVFAFGSSYSTLFIARAIQGVGSACTSVAGMSMLADRFPDDAERGHAMSIALGGLAMGVVIGPPFGGFMYEFVGKSSPFIVLAILALADGLLQLLVLQPKVSKSPEEGASLMTLIKDPYILIAAGAITFANTGIAILEPALPLWMMDTMHAKNWEQGVAFLPAALSYMLGTNLFGTLGHRMGRSLAAMIGLLLIGCSLLLIPFATRVEHLIVPNGIIGFAMGMVDSTMMPMLGYLVDVRHTSVYGSVYAIGDVAFCASFAFGPALSGTLVELIGFEGLIITTAFICFGFSPLMLMLKREEERPDQLLSSQEETRAVREASLRYVNYEHLDSPDDDQKTVGNQKREPTYVR